VGCRALSGKEMADNFLAADNLHAGLYRLRIAMPRYRAGKNWRWRQPPHLPSARATDALLDRIRLANDWRWLGRFRKARESKLNL